MAHQCWCCRCGRWWRWAAASPSPGTPCRRPASSQPGWPSGSCGCGTGSRLGWADLAGPAGPGCPESASESLGTSSQSCGPRSAGSSPGPVAAEETGGVLLKGCVCVCVCEYVDH